jgi:hypothetical protein
VTDGVLIDDIATTSKTLPQFTTLWHAMLGAKPAPKVSPSAVP